MNQEQLHRIAAEVNASLDDLVLLTDMEEQKTWTFMPRQIEDTFCGAYPSIDKCIYPWSRAKFYAMILQNLVVSQCPTFPTDYRPVGNEDIQVYVDKQGKTHYVIMTTINDRWFISISTGNDFSLVTRVLLLRTLFQKAVGILEERDIPGSTNWEYYKNMMTDYMNRNPIDSGNCSISSDDLGDCPSPITLMPGVGGESHGEEG